MLFRSMPGIDVVDAAVEPLMQIDAKADLAASAQMDIGDLDDFHATFPGNCFAVRPKQTETR